MNEHRSQLITFAVALIACLAAAAPALAAQPAAVSAQFDGELLVAEDAPAFLFSGTILVASDKMKIDVVQQATLEHALILVDFTAGLLTILYPDTLNGQRYKLEEFDHLQGFARIRDALDGIQPELPPGWEETANEKTQLDGVDCTFLSALSPDGLAVELWTGTDNLPLRATAKQATISVVITTHDFEPVDSLDDSAFLIPEGYTVSDAEEDAPAGLPQL